MSKDVNADLVKFLAKTVGRDKLFRTIQFAARILKWQAERKDPKSADIAKW